MEGHGLNDRLDAIKVKLLEALVNNIKVGGANLSMAWCAIPGNSVDISYFAGVVARNPSGSTDNEDTILYKSNGVTMITQVFTYNLADGITNITAS